MDDPRKRQTSTATPAEPGDLPGGLVRSLNRPGGNITGVNSMNMELVPKRMELLRQLLPSARLFGFLINPSLRRFIDSLALPDIAEATPSLLDDVRQAARTLGIEVRVMEANSDISLYEAFTKLADLGADGVVLSFDPFFSSRVEQIAELALRQAGWLGSACCCLCGGRRSFSGDKMKGDRPGLIYRPGRSGGNQPRAMNCLTASKVPSCEWMADTKSK